MTITIGKGISGDYVVTLGENSFAESGNSPNLPTLSASVGAFSRMWFGIRDASSLVLTDTLDGPMGLFKGILIVAFDYRPRTVAGSSRIDR
ncbi:MAG: hypothetical protein Ct9H300mP8_06370 [Gammaproteobacteria bacterium]|nr:MAG: hypothetical protein Ct9H300mP8_06370 [Gammaproteobacteria bacterium]